MSTGEIRFNVRSTVEDRAFTNKLADAAGLTPAEFIRQFTSFEVATIQAVVDVGSRLGLPLGKALNYIVKDRLAQLQAELDVDGLGLLGLNIRFENGVAVEGAREFALMCEQHRAPLIAQRLRDIAGAGGPAGEQDEAFLERFAPKPPPPLKLPTDKRKRAKKIVTWEK